MGRPELGAKCTCAGCHERFYDLNRSPAICPKCGVEQPPEKPRALRPPRSSFGMGSQPRQRPAAATIDDEAEPADASEAEGDVPEVDDDDDTEVDADLGKEAE
jgi:uncharacterized protein (TIGR02300 family)